jgi:hypothetical protein
VDSLLVTAAELHVRADLGVVDVAEKDLGRELLARPVQAAPDGATTTGAQAEAG